MFAPLSLKQHRENAKFQAKEARESAKMENDESRKQSLHEIKLQEAALKANQGIGHKEQLHKAKMADLGAPLGKGKAPNNQKLGIPSMNPLAGTEVFRQGQHSMPKPMQYAMGTDTVPAMLTPGEAVIPAPAAQNPKNKKAIKRMVKEGRQANELRDGAADVRYSDAPGQAKYHADGTIGVVPSLAYAHPDIPGSSFEDGTPMVYDFNRGSSAQANYADGTKEVPQQVQSAAGYANGTVSINNMLAVIPKVAPHRKVKGYEDGVLDVPTPVPQDLQKDNWDTTKTYDFSQDVPMPSEGIELAAATPEYLKNKQVVSDVPTKTSVYGSAPGSSRNYNEVPVVPVTVVDVPKTSDVSANNKPVVPAGTSQTTKVAVPQKEIPYTASEVGYPNLPENEFVPSVDTTKEEPGGVPYDELTATRKEYFTPLTPQEASSKVKSLAGYVEELGGVHKTEKPFVESFKNLFNGGLKEELGLNNQDILKMAISTFVGSKRYGFNRALAYAGAKAFDESSKRNVQEQAQDKAIRSAAVQMRAQDIRSEDASKAALARENRDVQRAAAKEAHDRFIAAQQVKMAEIKDEYNRTRDSARFEQQMRVLAQQQAGMESRMQSTFGNQWAMMLGREALRENSPIAKMERLSKHTNDASSAVSEIYSSILGSPDIKGNANPNRIGLPTPKEVAQQGLSYFKQAGIDISNPDIAQEATLAINQATRQMIDDKKSGRVKSTASIGPYIANNIVTHKMGLTPDKFAIGDKQTPPEKITSLFADARRAVAAPDGTVDQSKLSKVMNTIATDWETNAVKNKYRDKYKGTANESAFYQFAEDQLKQLQKK